MTINFVASFLAGLSLINPIFAINRTTISPWLFVMDDTGSMGNEITSVQNFLHNAVTNIESLGYFPEYYIYSQFDDPTISAARYEDSASFLSVVDATVASGGGDCPEYAFGGIKAALDLLDASSTTTQKGEMFLFTDAPEKDLDASTNADFTTIATLLAAKNVRLHTFYSVSNCGLDSQFYDLSVQTGGLFLIASSETFAGALTIMNDFIDGSDTTTLVRLILDGIPGVNMEVTVSIDASVECFRVQVGSSTTTDGILVITDASGDEFDLDEATDRIYTDSTEWVNICLDDTSLTDDAKYGEWTIESSYSVYGTSPYVIVYTTDAGIAFDFNLVDSVTLSSIGGFVVYSDGSYLRTLITLADSADASLLGSVNSISLIDADGASVTITEAVLVDGDTYYADFSHNAIVDLGIEYFYVTVLGTDIDGHTFTRTSESIYQIIDSGINVNIDCGSMGVERVWIPLNSNLECIVTVTVDDASEISSVELTFENDNSAIDSFVTIALSETTVDINSTTMSGTALLDISNIDGCSPDCTIDGEFMTVIVWASFGSLGSTNRVTNFDSQLLAFGSDSTDAPTKGPSEFPSKAPSHYPTQSPLWIEPCSTSPCSCAEDTLCDTCGTDGCEACIPGAFSLSADHPCTDCRTVFGTECNWCKNDIGCMACRSGYTRTYDDSEDLYFCVEDEPIEDPDPSVDEITYVECATDNCLGDTNDYCVDQRSNFCARCADGYWRKNNDYICVSCDIIPYCESCSPTQWGGCTSCESPYVLRWDSTFGYRRCLAP